MLLERLTLPVTEKLTVPMKRAAVQIEGWCFDMARGIDTAARGHRNIDYLPSRATVGRRALRGVPIKTHHEYTFIDIGSGKGRMLFVAAEFPFRRIQGIEFDLDLHRQAEENISRYRSGRRKCGQIESLHINAVDYDFPNENLVIYLFNPFRPEIMRQVLANLEESLKRNRRAVFLTLLWPVLATVVQSRPGWRAIDENPRYCIYEAV